MVKTYPTLYARTALGKIQVWWMEQDNDKYRSISGQEDGATVSSGWTVAEPKNSGKKNATTAIEQSTAEIQAKYKKQLKSGGYFENPQDIDKQRFFQPMLAEEYPDFKDKIEWSKDVAVQIKYNGGRIIATKDGLFTRTGERYVSIPHIEDALKPFFVHFPNAVLDGEGFNYELREQLNEIMKLLRKTVNITPKDLARSKELIRFYVYDGYGFPMGRGMRDANANDCYTLRKTAIDNSFFSPYFKDRWKDIIGFVPTWFVNSEKKLELLYEKFLADKQEGAIIRILGVPYQNKRTKYLLKYKPVDDAEFKIIAVKEGVGKFANRVSTVTCQRIDGGVYEDGTDIFEATWKGTDADAKKAWLIKDQLIDKIVTIYFNKTTGKGKPNYPRFDWKNYNKGH